MTTLRLPPPTGYRKVLIEGILTLSDDLNILLNTSGRWIAEVSRRRGRQERSLRPILERGRFCAILLLALLPFVLYQAILAGSEAFVTRAVIFGAG
ncbi:MAG: hypothetical protein SFU56_11590 [Capsulimonadales bacterium]|nr:hypothetical protein [Capsulimonadales bacterium]